MMMSFHGQKTTEHENVVAMFARRKKGEIRRICVNLNVIHSCCLLTKYTVQYKFNYYY